MTEPSVTVTDRSRPLRVRAFVRSCPVLTPNDPIGMAMAIMAQWHMQLVPVTDERGKLVGVVTEPRIRALLAAPSRECVRASPVQVFIEPAEVVLHEDAPVADARDALSRSAANTAMIVDRRGRLLGAVWWADLLDDVPPMVSVPNVGGMATPFGVYLSAGAARAGVTPKGLFVAGLWLGILIALAYLVTGGVCLALDHVLGTKLAPIWYSLEPPHGTAKALTWLGMQVASGLIFLFLLRKSAMTAYHAAEHQVAHALDRGLPLEYEVVARMPRVHPRCGTSIAAAAVLFGGITIALVALGPPVLDGVWMSMIAAVVTLTSWRRLGTWLQEHVTTRTPTEAQLRETIRVGETLREAYLRGEQGTVSRLRWIWNTGAIPVALGTAAGVGAAIVLVDALLGRLPW